MGKNHWSGCRLECVSLGQRIGKMKVETSVFEGALHGKCCVKPASRVGKLGKLRECLNSPKIQINCSSRGFLEPE